MTSGVVSIGAVPVLAVALLAPAGAAAEVSFREASASWGLEFRHHNGGSGFRYYPETDGSGVVLFDYDGDGDLDVFFVDSAPLPGYEGEAPRSILYRNDGGRFVDVTDRSGIDVAGYGMGGVAADVEGDGDLDLYVTQFRRNQLFRNEGDGTFVDVTEEAGVGDERWSMSAAFGDLDHDGDLDLYVTNYIRYPLENATLCYNEELGVGAYCHPDLFDALPDRYYGNRGEGSFEDRTTEAGFDRPAGKAMGVVVVDLDDDGLLDLYVANDTTPNHLFLNQGEGRFADASLLSGTAFSDLGVAEAGMGVAVGDVDADGLPDLYVTNFALETNALYRNLGGGIFVDARHALGAAQPTLPMLGFGTAFADFDLDADLDLAIANGHILDNVDLMKTREDITYKQPNQILLNDGSGRLELAADVGVDVVRASRGLAVGDLDGDGDLDLVITNSNDRAEVYENRTPSRGGWLQVDLGESSGGALAVGSRIETMTLSAEGSDPRRIQRRDVLAGDSYLSQSALSAHFGLGAAPRVDRLRIRWADGARQELRDLPRDRQLRVTRLRPPLAEAPFGSRTAGSRSGATESR